MCYVLTSQGQTVDIHSMDTEEFVKFTESMQFPPLLDSQEEEIKTDVTSVVNKFLSRLSKRQKDTAVDYLTRTTKFLALLVSILSHWINNNYTNEFIKRVYFHKTEVP